MTAETRDAESLVLISTFVVPAAAEDAFLAWWRMVRPFLALQPGFVSATLHRSLDERERYRFVNVAEWRSPPAPREMLAKLWSSAPKAMIPGFDWSPTLYEIVERS